MQLFLLLLPGKQRHPHISRHGPFRDVGWGGFRVKRSVEVGFFKHVAGDTGELVEG